MSARNRLRKAGITRLECAIVAGLLCVAIAIIAPLLLSAREKARQETCGNNLSMFQRAAASYYDANGVFPPGSTGKTDGDLKFPPGWGDDRVGRAFPMGHFGWPAVLLPHLGDDDLYGTINFDEPAFARTIPEGSADDIGPYGHRENAFVSTHMPPVFVCPSAHRVQPVTEFKDYAMNGGSGERCCADRCQVDCIGGPGFGKPMDGFGFMNSALTTTDFPDGMAQTCAFIEFAHWGNHGSTDVDRGANQFVFVHSISQGYVTASEHPTFGGAPSSPNTQTWNHRAAHSDHPGGVLAVFSDGHYSFLVDDIDASVYRAMFSRLDSVPDVASDGAETKK